MKSSPNRAAILDRDGTINEDTGEPERVEGDTTRSGVPIKDLRFIPGAVEAIRMLNEAGFRVIVATNQSGVGRGWYTDADVRQFHKGMNAELAEQGAHIDAFYYCPHHPDAAKGEYRKVCGCRKPEPGMLKQAIAEHGIDEKQSFMIGDAGTDVAAGRCAGLTTILLTAATSDPESGHVAPDLLAAVKLILEGELAHLDRRP
jgi:D-glycero-D-manno-heptose 1,7-bisphosphate phosphatase